VSPSSVRVTQSAPGDDDGGAAEVVATVEGAAVGGAAGDEAVTDGAAAGVDEWHAVKASAAAQQAKIRMRIGANASPSWHLLEGRRCAASCPSNVRHRPVR
jgi:hypothetical protein